MQIQEPGLLETFRGIVALAVQDDLLSVPELPHLSVLPSALDEVLRDYQAEAVLAATQAPLMCGIIKAPTGAGKTRIAAGIMGTVGGRWLLSAPSQGLLLQLRKSIEELELPLDFQMELLSFGQLEQAEGHYDGLICDECHRIAAKSWAENTTSVDSAYRVGLSATPLKRSDPFNAVVVGLLGPLVYDIELPLLQGEEYLAKGKIVRRTFKHG
jgi:superfamily II DNA or RNA helicase